MIDYKELYEKMVLAYNEAIAIIEKARKEAIEFYFKSCQSGKEKFDPAFFDKLVNISKIGKDISVFDSPNKENEE